MALSITKKCDTQHNDTKHYNKNATLSIILGWVSQIKPIKLRVVMLNVVILNVIMLSVVMLPSLC